MVIEIEKTKQPGLFQHIFNVLLSCNSVENDPAFIIKGILEDRSVAFTIRASTLEEAEEKRDRMTRELREMELADFIAKYRAAGLLK